MNFTPLNEEAILDLHRYEGQVDQLLLYEVLKAQGKADETGGVCYLAELASEVATGSNVRYHGRILKQYALSRSLLSLTQEVQEKLYQQSPAIEVSQWALTRLLELTRAHEQRRGHTLREIMAEVDIKFAEACRIQRRWAGLDCGFPEINDLLNGLCPLEMTILGARPKVGKTRLALQMARCIAASGQGAVLIYSLEMGRVQLGEFWGCMLADLDLTRFRRGWVTEEGKERYRTARAALDNWPVIVDDISPLSIPELYATTERHLAVHPDIRLVVIDFLQKMVGPDRNGETAKIDAICQGLADYKKRYPVHLLVISQLSRSVEERADRRPQIDDLRGSGMIEALLDNSLLLYRPGAYDHLRAREGDRVEIIAPLLRNAAPGVAHLQWDNQTGAFYSTAYANSEEYAHVNND